MLKESYLTYLKDNEELAPATIREYKRMLNLFYQEIAEPFKDVNHTTQTAFENAIKTIASRFRWSTGTRYRMSILIESYGEYALREGIVDRKPYINTFKKGNGKRVEFFTEEEFYKTTFNPFHSISDFVMMILFWDCGMRKEELINLNIGDVDLKGRMIRIINNKTDKERINPITKFTHVVLTFYLSCLGVQGKLRKESPLFYSPTWERLHESTLARHMKSIEKTVPFKVYAHKLRHSLAGRILGAGGDRFLVKDLLGHENFNTTAIYTHFEKTQKKAMYEKLLEV